MAKIAHLILTHQHPGQVSRLARAIAHPLHDVYIHVDKKQDILPFRHLLDNAGVRFIIKRTRVDWGAYSTVEAMLSSMSEILERGRYDFINLMSGSDYPLAEPSVVDHFLNGHPQKTFIEFYRQGSTWWERARTRTEKIHLTNYRFKGKYLLQYVINTLPFKRKAPMGLELVGSSQWFTMATTHVSYVLDFVKKHPEVVRFFKHAWGPDEFFFQTILLNSPFQDEIVNDNLRYIDFSDGMASPRILTDDDYPLLISSKKMYARKFAANSPLLDMLDAHRRTS